MQRKFVTIVVCTTFSIVDIGLSTVIFSHGSGYHYHFTEDVRHYSFQGSLFDLWVLSLLRTVILLGAVLAVVCNPLDAVRRISNIKQLVFVISVLMWSFNITKLMVASELNDNLKQAWFWAMFGWTAVAAVALSLDWILLAKFNQSVLSSRSHDSIINSKPDERRPLIGSNGTGKKSMKEDKTSEEIKEKLSRATLCRLLSYSKPDWFLILLGFIFLTASAVGEIFIPYYTGLVIDGIVIEKSRSKFTSAVVIMGLISLGSAITAGLRGGCFVLAISRLNIRLRNLLFSSITNQEIGFFDEIRTGDITSRLTSDITTMSDTLGLNVNVFLRSTIKAGGVIFFMIKLSIRLTGVTVIAMPIIVAVSKVYGKYYKKLSKAVQDSLAGANDVAEEVCSSMRTVRSFANEEGERDRYKTSLGETYKLQKKQAVAYAGFAWCTQIFDLSLSVAVLYYGGHLVVNNKMTGGNLVSFILYQLELGNCIQGIGAVYTGLMQAAGASEKVFEYIDRRPTISNTGQYRPGQLEGQLEFRNVTFSYPSRPEAVVLKNLSFHVNPGEVVALVGPSGGGKSSCVNLLEHFYECASGEILLDRVPIQRYDHKYLHQKISLVGQEPVLYARSIWDNIAYGASGYPEGAVTEAAHLANAHRFIVELPDGYETKAGDKGLQLSGGQKQRIAIARALIRNPTVLILDEATSALDAESEHVVQKAIYKNLQGRTVIIIAHRLSMVERADRILVIDKGTILQQGRHKELLHQDGLYAKLVQRQLLGFDSDLHEQKDSAHGGRDVAAGRRPGARECTSDSRSPQNSVGSYDSVNLLHRNSGSLQDSPPHVNFHIGSQ